MEIIPHQAEEFVTKERQILDFWFGTRDSDMDIIKEKSALWWGKDNTADQEIKSLFSDDLERVIDGEFNHWTETPTGRLALIILTDQFSRNIYRGTTRAFAQDALALKWCLEGLEYAVDTRLRPVHRVFFYLPLEHSESLDHQIRSIECFTALIDSISPEHKKAFSGFLDFAVKHREIIERFGRFPHRNSILGRKSTAEETEFLKQPGSSF